MKRNLFRYPKSTLQTWHMKREMWKEKIPGRALLRECLYLFYYSFCEVQVEVLSYGLKLSDN